MAYKHAYVSAQGNLTKVVNHFRKSFPATVTAETLKKLGFAPKNESYVINVLKSLELIDEDGKRTQEASKVFTMHDAAAFAEAFAGIVKSAYGDLFELHGDSAWDLDSNGLITFFRQTDQTSEIVGKRQAATFKTLAAYSGHAEMPTVKATTSVTASVKKTTKKKPAKVRGKAVRRETPSESKDTDSQDGTNVTAVGLTVRVEVNLPSDADQETYDRIFKSIRENLLNG